MYACVYAVTNFAFGTVGVCVPLPDFEPGTPRSEFLSDAIAARPDDAVDDDVDLELGASLLGGGGVVDEAVGAMTTGGMGEGE